jgi:tRNA G18 (ribose-2'-O)-methylase SpoU
MQAILVLHDIRSAQNVGSLFRTADAAGISKIYLSSITPGPVDRFGRPRADVAKTALGAQLTVPFEQYGDIEEIIQKYKSRGFTIVAIEQAENSVDYKTIQPTEHMVFILGNEVEGVPSTILALCDYVAEIPMGGKKESLNVSVAGGIALFRMLGK